MSVDLVATDRDLLEQALKSLNYRYTRAGDNFQVGDMQIKGNEIIGISRARMNAIRRQYSIETVKKVAKMKGWTGAWKMSGHGA